jgi:hypothetical protein
MGSKAAEAAGMSSLLQAQVQSPKLLRVLRQLGTRRRVRYRSHGARVHATVPDACQRPSLC